MTKQVLTIGERKFTVENLKAGQIEQLQELLDYNIFEGFDGKVLRERVGKNVGTLCKFIAIVVKEDGVDLEKKDLEELTNFFKFNAEQDDLIKAINFFSAVSKEKSKGQSTNKKSTDSSSRKK